jgi:hypothetical protein
LAISQRIDSACFFKRLGFRRKFCGKGTISQGGKSREEGGRNEKRNDQWLKIYKNLKIRKILQKKPFLRLEKPLVPYFFLKNNEKIFYLTLFQILIFEIFF